MSNMLSIYRRRVSLALKIETIARIDAKAKAEGSTRNVVAEYILASALANLRLSKEDQEKIVAEIEANRKTRKGR